MTYEETIKILHPDTTLMALAEVEYFGGFKGKEAKIKAVDEACVIACKALEKHIPKKPTRGEIRTYRMCALRLDCRKLLWRFGTVSILPKLRTGN